MYIDCFYDTLYLKQFLLINISQEIWRTLSVVPKSSLSEAVLLDQSSLSPLQKHNIDSILFEVRPESTTRDGGFSALGPSDSTPYAIWTSLTLTSRYPHIDATTSPSTCTPPVVSRFLITSKMAVAKTLASKFFASLTTQFARHFSWNYPGKVLGAGMTPGALGSWNMVVTLTGGRKANGLSLP